MSAGYVWYLPSLVLLLTFALKLQMASIAGCPLQCRTGSNLCNGNGVCGFNTDAKRSQCFCYTGFTGSTCSGGAPPGPGLSVEAIILIVILVALAAVVGLVVFMFLKLRKLTVDPGAYDQLQGRCESCVCRCCCMLLVTLLLHGTSSLPPQLTSSVCWREQHAEQARHHNLLMAQDAHGVLPLLRRCLYPNSQRYAESKLYQRNRPKYLMRCQLNLRTCLVNSIYTSAALDLKSCNQVSKSTIRCSLGCFRPGILDVQELKNGVREILREMFGFTATSSPTRSSPQGLFCADRRA